VKSVFVLALEKTITSPGRSIKVFIPILAIRYVWTRADD
jgi:hypothetical protein